MSSSPTSRLRELVQLEPGGERGGADRGGVDVADELRHAAGRRRGGRASSRTRSTRAASPAASGEATRTSGAGPARPSSGERRGVHQPAAGDDHDVVDGLLRPRTARGWRPARCGPRRPGRAGSARSQADALGVEAVGGLVEQQHPRVAEQRRGERRAAAACRARTRRPGGSRRRRGPTSSSTSSRARVRDADLRRVARRRWSQRGAAGVEARRLERGADDAQRAGRGRRSAARRSSRCPTVGRTRPSSMRSVVVLPAPFGPRKPVTRPGRDREARGRRRPGPGRSAWTGGRRDGVGAVGRSWRSGACDVRQWSASGLGTVVTRRSARPVGAGRERHAHGAAASGCPRPRPCRRAARPPSARSPARGRSRPVEHLTGQRRGVAADEPLEHARPRSAARCPGPWSTTSMRDRPRPRGAPRAAPRRRRGSAGPRCAGGWPRTWCRRSGSAGTVRSGGSTTTGKRRPLAAPTSAARLGGLLRGSRAAARRRCRARTAPASSRDRSSR